MRVVLDTSVLVAAARSRNGASHAVLRLLPDKVFYPVISVPLFVEYQSVLLRPENLIGRSPEQAEKFLDGLLAWSCLQEIYFSWRPMLTDPNDDHLFELAVAGSCKYVVTHNVRDFRGTERFGIEVVTPGNFLKLIR